MKPINPNRHFQLGKISSSRAKQSHSNDGFKIEWYSPVVLLSLLLTGLYMFGYSYTLGYLEGFGIDIDLFPRSVEGYAAKAFVGVLSIFSVSEKEVFDTFIFGVAFIVVVFGFGGYLITGTLQILSKRRVKFPKWNIHSDIALRAKMTFLSAAIGTIPFVVVVLILYILMFALVPASFGISVARKQFENYKKINCEKEVLQAPANQLADCVTVFSNDEIVKGIEIASSTDSIAIFTHESVTVVSLKEGYKIVRNRKK
jgi:hypothetical protein